MFFIYPWDVIGLISSVTQRGRIRKRKESDTLPEAGDSTHKVSRKIADLKIPSLYEVIRQKSLDRSSKSSEQDLNPNHEKYDREYQTVKVLGKGGFGLVFQSKRRGDGQDLAVKRIKLASGSHKTKVWREARLHSMLFNYDVDKTHLVQYFDSWEENINLEKVRNHDQEFITEFNKQHQDRTEYIEDTETEPCTFDRLETDTHESKPESSQSALHSFDNLNVSYESWQGSDSWSDSDEETNEKEYIEHERTNLKKENPSSESGLRLRRTLSSFEDQEPISTGSCERFFQMKYNR